MRKAADRVLLVNTYFIVYITLPRYLVASAVDESILVIGKYLLSLCGNKEQAGNKIY